MIFITGFNFQSQSCFLFFVVVVFHAFILHAMESPGCTNLFFLYIFFPWLHVFYTRLFSKSLASCPFQLDFFKKLLASWFF